MFILAVKDQSVMENIKADKKNLLLNILILWTINLTKNLTEYWTKEYVWVIKFTKQMKYDFKKILYVPKKTCKH